jgi:protein-ribulosamine 3-kinase
MFLKAELDRAIARATSGAFEIVRARRLGGGCINQAYLVEGASQRYFVKLNAADHHEMFEAEAAGLLELSAPGVIRVPQPICAGIARDKSFLVLEHLTFASQGNMAAFGRQLAALHRKHKASFGWHRDNALGLTLQINTPSQDWCEFWRRYRLGFQLHLAARNGYRGALQQKGERLLAHCDVLFSGYHPRPSLLHGDLWSGNYAMDTQGHAVIFDPAVYYGDREADLAMTELFGGFSEDFYCAYQEAYPVDSGYGPRKVFYNLYHILNHLNLFGGAYAAQAERMLDRLLGELSR